MIEVLEALTKKQQKEFLEFPLKLYRNNPYFVPPLYGDEKQIFSKNYHYYETCEAVYYNAYKDGKMVGRISGILQKSSNEKWKEKKVRFTRFDAIDDVEVSRALFSKLSEWAKEKGMNQLTGPLGFSDLEREGLLIEGFEELSTFEEQYNYPYYQALIEDYGFVKEVDWVERKLFKPQALDERLGRLSAMMLKRYNLRYSKSKNINEFLKDYGNQFFEILDETYDEVYGTVPFTESMKKSLISNFKLIVDVRHVCVILDEEDRVVAFGLCFPSIAKAVQKSQGHLTPFGIIRLLRAIKHPKVIDLALIGVRKEYQMRGIASSLVFKIMEILINENIDYAETNLNLEDNFAIQNQWKNFDNVLHKRRRSFIKEI